MEQGNGKDDLKDSGRTETQPYLVRVSIPNLNIRKGPGTNYGKTGRYTSVGVFTIEEEADGQGAARWGRLKSGSGWIFPGLCQKNIRGELTGLIDKTGTEVVIYTYNIGELDRNIEKK